MNQFSPVEWPPQEWPLGRPAEATEHAPSPPPRFYELTHRVRKSEAVEAFARRRAGQIKAGFTAEADLARGIGQLAAEAQYRLSALQDILGSRYRMNLPPRTRTDCLKYIEGAGGILLALWERCQVEVPEE